MKLTVLIPLHNCEALIGRALASALREPVDEVLVVDDGSTDGGPGVVERAGDGRVRLIRQANAGAGAARNRGLRSTDADYVAFLDADDEFLPGHIARLRALIGRCPGAAIYSTSYVERLRSGRDITPRFRGLPRGFTEGYLPDYVATLLGDPIVWMGSTAVDRRAALDAGGFAEGEGMGCDLDLWLRLGFEGKVAHSRAPGAIYHRALEGLSRSRTINARRVIEGTIDGLAAKDGLSPERRELLLEYKNRTVLDTVTLVLLGGRAAEARGRLLEMRTRRFMFKRAVLLTFTCLPAPLVRGLYWVKNWIYERVR